MMLAITGASGFFGQTLVRLLAGDEGVGQIRMLDVRPPAFQPAMATYNHWDMLTGDDDGPLEGCDALVHLAFIEPRPGADEAGVVQDNVRGVTRVTEAVARAGVGQLVHASSVAAYGFHADNTGRILDESAPCRGNTDFYYPDTKARSEQVVASFAADHPGVIVTVLRPSVVLGPSQAKHLGWLKLRVQPYLRGPAPPIHLTHEHDVAAAFQGALHHRQAGAFNIATEAPLPVRQWGPALGKPGLPLPRSTVRLGNLAHRLGRMSLHPGWMRLGSRLPIVVNSQRARQELGWQPQFATTGDMLRALALGLEGNQIPR